MLNATRRLKAEHGHAFTFALVYVVDPHPLTPDPSVYRGVTWMLPYSKYRQARRFDERVANAKSVLDEGLFEANLLDWLAPRNASGNNPVWCAWGPAPNAGWLVAPDGKIRLAQSWFDDVEMNATMAAMAAE
jgi:hypothetical protein